MGERQVAKEEAVLCSQLEGMMGMPVWTDPVGGGHLSWGCDWRKGPRRQPWFLSSQSPEWRGSGWGG